MYMVYRQGKNSLKYEYFVLYTSIFWIVNALNIDIFSIEK